MRKVNSSERFIPRDVIRKVYSSKRFISRDVRKINPLERYITRDVMRRVMFQKSSTFRRNSLGINLSLKLDLPKEFSRYKHFSEA
jgi:hypothetical protein